MTTEHEPHIAGDDWSSNLSTTQQFQVDGSLSLRFLAMDQLGNNRLRFQEQELTSLCSALPGVAAKSTAKSGLQLITVRDETIRDYTFLPSVKTDNPKGSAHR